MKIEDFKQQMKQYKQARESNPSLSYWEWKVNKYSDGTDKIISNNNKFEYFDGVLKIFNPLVDKYINNKLKYIFGNLSKEEIRNRLYSNIYPFSYDNYADRLEEAIKNNIPENFGRNQYIRDDIFATYLNIPEQNRRKLDRFNTPNLFGRANKVVPSKYTPTQSNGGQYFTLENMASFYTPDYLDILIQDANGIYSVKQNQNLDNVQSDTTSDRINFGQNKLSYALSDWFGQHTISRGLDPKKGEYVSYYDKWDLSPIKKHGSDESLGIGNPIEFYDRIYLDDYYKIDNTPPNGVYYGGYLPEIRIISKTNKYSDGTDGIVDKLKSNSRNTLTPEEQQYLLNKSRQRQRMSGAITPVFNIQDAVDFTPVGDVLAARDTYNAFRDQDYITASAMLGLMLAPPALGKIAKEAVPSFVTAAADKINELRRKERRNKELDIKIFSQGIEDRNRIIEELYDTPGIWDRAYNTDITYGTNYVDTYNDLINNYYSNYFNLPEPRRTNIGDAKAKMTATQAAIDRYNLDGTPASWGDFEYLISPDIEQLDKALTRHELGHYVDFNMSRSSNPDAGNLMFNEMRKDLSIDPNPMMPSETSYFRTGSEQKSYMNTLRQFMFDNNMINKIDDKVTTKKIQEAIDKLPSELKSVKAAYKQFKSPRKYTKWFNTIPLLGVTPFMLNYSEENNSN